MALLQEKDALEVFGDRKLIIYGAGKIGRRISQALVAHGIDVSFFWDRQAEAIREVSGIPVLPPDLAGLAHKNDYCVLVTTYSPNITQAIADELAAAGFAHVVSERAIINRLIFMECQRQKASDTFDFNLLSCHMCPVQKDTETSCSIFDAHVATSLAREAPETLEFVIPSMGLLVSNRCTLTCEGCNHLRDLYAPSDHVDVSVDDIKQDLTKIVNAVDLVRKLVVVGGEAFVHKKIGTILRDVMELPRIGVVHIITNGTVVPKDDSVYQLLARPNVIVEISNYGDNVPPNMRANIVRFIEKLEQHGVHFYHTPETLQWFDFGGFEYRKYSPRELKEVYRSCCFVSNDLFNGQLHKCSRGAFGTMLKKIPAYPGDFVDVRRTPQELLRDALMRFFANDMPGVCQHCNGTSTATILAGVQVTKQKKRVG